MRRRGQQEAFSKRLEKVLEEDGKAVSKRLESPSAYTNRSRAPVTREEYGKAWEAYSNEPTVEAVRRALDCGNDVAHRLVFEGLPVLALPGLEKRLQEEARLGAKADARLSRGTERLTAEGAARVMAARAKAVKEVVEKEAAVLGDAVSQRVEEAKLVRANREGALVLADVTGKLLRSASRLVGYLDDALEEVEAKGFKGTKALEELGLRPGSALDLVKSMATVANRTAQVSEASVRMERLLMGDPTSIIQVQGGGSSSKPMSLEEATSVMREANKAFERHRMRAAAVDVQVEESGHA